VKTPVSVVPVSQPANRVCVRSSYRLNSSKPWMLSVPYDCGFGLLVLVD